MVLTASAPVVMRLRVLRFAILVIAGSLAAHDLVVFLRRLVDGVPAAADGGGGAAMAAMGDTAAMADMAAMDPHALAGHVHHPDYWTWLTIVALVVAGAFAVVGIRRIGRLARAVRLLPATEGAAADGAPGSYLAELDHLWPRLFLAITILFTVQENLGFAAQGSAMNGAAILFCPEHPLAIPALGIVSLLFAAVGAWLRWRTASLVARLRAAHLALSFPRPAAAAAGHRWRLVAARVCHCWIVFRRLAGRAPPLAAGA